MPPCRPPMDTSSQEPPSSSVVDSPITIGRLDGSTPNQNEAGDRLLIPVRAAEPPGGMKPMPGRSVDREIDKLYGLSPEEFTAARDGLAKELKAAGDQSGATSVKALRRPTVAAWAVNQVVRREPKGADGLLEAGDE